MRKYLLFTIIAMAATLSANAQSLDKMQWFNEPEYYRIKNGSPAKFRV